MQLRYQQTLVELGGDKSTIVFPLPLDLIAPFLRQAGALPEEAPGTGEMPPQGVSSTPSASINRATAKHA